MQQSNQRCRAHTIDFLESLSAGARLSFRDEFLSTEGVWARRGRFRELQAVQVCLRYSTRR